MILAISGSILLRLLVVISSALTFGNPGAAPDEARLSSMALIFTVIGTVVALLRGGRQITRPDQCEVGFMGGVFGLLTAAVLHAVIRSIEPALGTLSASVGAILMVWAALGAVIGLVLAVVIRHDQDSAEVAG